jgi:hypothetical protein
VPLRAVRSNLASGDHKLAAKLALPRLDGRHAVQDRDGPSAAPRTDHSTH